MDRRQFIHNSLAATTLLAGGSLLAAETKKTKLKKAVKFGMIGVGKTIQEKFEAIKKAGFLGVEIDSPSSLNLEEANKAQEATGIKIHGVIDSVHWNEDARLSSPDEKAREKGLEAVKTALKAAKTVGADTMLLVPGVVTKDVTYEQCWERSQAEVKKALPVAEETGVKIAIEVVWNNFITKPEQLVEYVDSFKSKFVGAYFDCSNMIKYGVPSADWIRKLGKRMLKFDFKGYSKAKQWVPVGEGDEDWPEIVKALGEIGYEGWATAEIGRCNEEQLSKLAATMDKILEIA
jgi:hexulose-6-phosphate isomerase